MVDVSKYLGNFLKAEDLEGKPPMTLTISAVVEQRVGREDQAEDKIMMQFVEIEQMLALNSTNLKLLVKFFKSKDGNEWIGKKIVLYHDPSVNFKGKLVGGLRIRI